MQDRREDNELKFSNALYTYVNNRTGFDIEKLARRRASADNDAVNKYDSD